MQKGPRFTLALRHFVDFAEKTFISLSSSWNLGDIVCDKSF